MNIINKESRMVIDIISTIKLIESIHNPNICYNLKQISVNLYILLLTLFNLLIVSFIKYKTFMIIEISKF